MNLFKSISFLLSLMVAITSCKETTINPDENLLGMWTVTKVEGRQVTNGVPGLILTDDAPTGFIRFDDDGRGEQNYSFTLFGNTYPQINNFFWTATDTEIRIDLFGKDDMIWTRNKNQTDKQEATYSTVINSLLTIEYALTLEK